MTSVEEIRRLSRRIGRDFQPVRIVLFGSHARGDAAEDSDVDLLVVLRFKGRAVDKAVEIRLKTRPRFPVDLVVRTPEDVRERVAHGDTFLRDILETGTILYEADHR